MTKTLSQSILLSDGSRIKNKGRFLYGINKTANTYDDVFEDVMQYMNIDITQFDSVNDLLQEIVSKDRRNQISQTLLDEFTDTDVVQRHFDETGERIDPFSSLRDKALDAESRRKTTSRLRDESKTSKRTFKINKKSLMAWMKNPNRLDLVGIDTKEREQLVSFQKQRIQEYKQKGEHIRLYKNTIPIAQQTIKTGKEKGNIRYFNILNGYRVSKKTVQRSHAA